MITLDVGARGLGRSRFALSKAVEAVSSLDLLLRASVPPYLEQWAVRARRRVDTDRIAVLMAVVEHAAWSVPEFLTPRPERYEPSMDEEVARVAATPAATVDRQLRTAFRIGAVPGHGPSGGEGERRATLPTAVADVLARGGERTLATVLAAQLRIWFDAVLGEHWAPVRATLEGDVRRRAVLASQVGLGAMVSGLGVEVTWTGTSLGLVGPVETRRDTPDGLVLTPSLFRMQPFACLDDDRCAMVVYPAAGRGTLWQPARTTNSAHEVLGAGVTALLADLDVARSTTELSVRHGLSPATVSYHLGRLARAGLLSRSRQGHRVLYERTQPGDTLLDAVRRPSTAADAPS